MPPGVPGMLSVLLPLLRFVFEGHREQFSNPRFVCDLVSCLATTGFSSADATGLPDWVRALAGIIMDAAVDSGTALASTQATSYSLAMFTSTLMISSGLLSLLRPWRARVHRGDADGGTPQTPTELLIAAAIKDHSWMIQSLLRQFRLDVNTTDDMGRTALFHAVQNGNTNTAWRLLRECAADPRGHALSARPERKIAFAMALHRRLGRDSRASALPPELLEAVLEACRDPSDVLSTVAARAGHADLASLLEWLEGLEDAPPVHKDANDAATEAASRGDFDCPACGENATSPWALVPCGHRVCLHCSLADDCPVCGVRVLHKVVPESYPAARPLLSRFCVRV
jgi:hypothetical protein